MNRRPRWAVRRHRVCGCGRRARHAQFADEGFKYVGGGYGYFVSKYDFTSHQWEQAMRWGWMFLQEGEDGRRCAGAALV